MTDFLTAVALLFVLEGLLYAAFPAGMIKMLDQLREMPAARLRIAGLFFATLGTVGLYLIRG